MLIRYKSIKKTRIKSRKDGRKGKKKRTKKEKFFQLPFTTTQQHNKTIKRKVFICFYIIIINKKQCKNQVFISKNFTLSIKARNPPPTPTPKGGKR